MKKHAAFACAFLVVCLCLFATNSWAQEQRKSPAQEMKATVDGVEVSVNYSAPSVNGRTIWGDLVPYDKVWRSGANEATVFTINQDVKVEGKELKKGTYSLFTIPGKETWTVIFNSVSDQWGAYKYNEKKDMLRITVKPEAIVNQQEQLVFKVSNDNDAGLSKITMRWDLLKVGFTLEAL